MVRGGELVVRHDTQVPRDFGLGERWRGDFDQDDCWWWFWSLLDHPPTNIKSVHSASVSPSSFIKLANHVAADPDQELQLIFRSKVRISAALTVTRLNLLISSRGADGNSDHLLITVVNREAFQDEQHIKPGGGWATTAGDPVWFWFCQMGPDNRGSWLTLAP